MSEARHPGNMKALLATLLVSTSLMAQNSFRVQVTGKGQPVVLIPGLSSNGETWDTTVARYKDRFECHVITLAGFVGVPRVATPAGGMLSKVLDELAAYIERNNLSKPVLIGHSLGGFIAMNFAVRYPDVPGRVVIVDTYPFTMGLDPTMTPAKAKIIATHIRSGIAAMSQESYEAYTKAGTSTNNLVTSEANQKRLIEWALASDRLSVAEALAEMLGADLRDDVAKIKVPTMVLAAWRGNEGVGASYQVVDKNVRDQYSKLAGVEIHVSDTSRHFIMWDDPQWMFGHVDRFLASK
jgi:pimeloyl-ACP methyl ester carboxylesterase